MPDGSANLDHLPDDPALLKGIVRELLAAIQDERRRNDQLTHRLDLLLKRVYGPRADKLDPSQLSLFDEPPVDSPVAALLPEPAPPPRPPRRTVMVVGNCPKRCGARRRSSISPSR